MTTVSFQWAPPNDWEAGGSAVDEGVHVPASILHLRTSKLVKP